MKRNLLAISALFVLLACLGLIACESGGGSGQAGQNDIYVPGMDTDTATPTATATATATPTATSTPTPTPTEDPSDCYEQMEGTWKFTTPRHTGTITFNQSKVITDITQSSCTISIVDTSKLHEATYSNGVVTVKYGLICNEKSYTYVLTLSFADNDCNTLIGAKEGTYSGGITEYIDLQKQ